MVRKCVIQYRKINRYKYQLQRDYRCAVDIRPDSDIDVSDGWFSLSVEGIARFRKGYSWDGPSGPALDTPNFMRASLVHDGLYQMMREGKLPSSYRKTADKIMRDICREDGMSRFRAWYTYQGVRAFGASRVKPKPVQPVVCAP